MYFLPSLCSGERWEEGIGGEEGGDPPAN